ncbi:MAG: 4-(cytidine 5'-diphospho)-2-C-methyl-D-erythritol kinase [bacterium]
MKKIKVKTPAKINLSLEIIKKRDDSFHEIDSIMQAINIFDELEITVSDNISKDNIIELSGKSKLIPYDNTNLCWIAANKFLEQAKINSCKINISIKKNIPVAAGLAGGSSNAAGVLKGLNSLFNDILSETDLHKLASSMGSDINFCLDGGTQRATSRGEILEKINTPDLNIAVVKPKDLFISAKEAYVRYAEIPEKPKYLSPESMLESINANSSEDISKLLLNHLEDAILPAYTQIKSLKALLKERCLNAIMSGSGPTVFGIYNKDIIIEDLFAENECFKAKSIKNGIIIV